MPLSAPSCTAVHWGAVQYIGQWSTVWCIRVQCSTVGHSAVQYIRVQCSTVGHSAVCTGVQCNALGHGVVRCTGISALGHGAVHWGAVVYSAVH